MGQVHTNQQGENDAATRGVMELRAAGSSRGGAGNWACGFWTGRCTEDAGNHSEDWQYLIGQGSKF